MRRKDRSKIKKIRTNFTAVLCVGCSTAMMSGYCLQSACVKRVGFLQCVYFQLHLELSLGPAVVRFGMILHISICWIQCLLFAAQMVNIIYQVVFQPYAPTYRCPTICPCLFLRVADASSSVPTRCAISPPVTQRNFFTFTPWWISRGATCLGGHFLLSLFTLYPLRFSLYICARCV